jgi:hypothetical protein
MVVRVVSADTPVKIPMKSFMLERPRFTNIENEMQRTLRLDSAKFQAATLLSASLESDNNYSSNVNDPMLFIRF